MAQKPEFNLISEQTKIVGDKGCEFGTIILALNKDETATISLKRDWKLLARELEIEKTDVKDLEDDMSLDIMEPILEKWRRKNGNKATLRSLITACTNADLWDVAAVLETIQDETDLC